MPAWRVTGAVLLGAAPVLLGAALVLAAVALLLVARRARTRALARRGLEASRAGNDADALRWLERAWRGGRDPQVGLELAWHLTAVRRLEDALAVYAALGDALPPGEATWHMAMLLFEHGGDLERVETLLVATLDAEPAFVEELRLEPDVLSAMSARPAFREAWRRAADGPR
ncbi:MAG: hypothetical protein QOE90_1766 [Thermoplasmata archaeon]|nr:hypothetical protein [Thermoplasmata archaeon]